jgi:hypothetical protein
MKKINIVFLFACIFFSANSQQMEISWITRAGGTGWDIVADMVELPNGQIVMTGSFYDKISFGGDTLFSNGERDIFIGRYNADGSSDKAVSFGGPGYDYVKNITLKARSGIVLPVQFNSELWIKGQSFKGDYLNNIVVAGFDKNLEPDGSFLLGSNGSFGINSLVTTPDSGFSFSGWFSDSLLVDSKTYIPEEGGDIFTGSVSDYSAIEWSKQLGKANQENSRTNAFATKGRGINYIAGITTGSSCIEKATGSVEQNRYLSLYPVDNEGNTGDILYPVHGLSLEPVKVFADSSFLWILVNFNYSAFINKTEIVSLGKGDVLLIKYNLKDHSSEWCQLGGYGNEKATGLVKSGDNMIVAGQFADSLTFAGKTVVPGRQGPDVFIASVNENCVAENIITFSGPGMDFPCAVIASGSGIYVAGEFRDSLVAGETVLVSAGEEDIFLARIENCGAKKPLEIIATPVDKQGWELDAGKGFVNYAWDGNLSSGRYCIVEAPGTFQVEVTDSTGCFYREKITLGTTKSAQINQEDEQLIAERPFKIYPTITSGVVYWEPASVWLKGKATVRVYDPLGRIISTFDIIELEPVTYNTDLRATTEGTYMVEISGDGFREVSKVVLKK